MSLDENEQIRSSFDDDIGNVLLKSIIETAADAIVVINSEGRICLANYATEKLFGYTSEELWGQNVSMLVPELHHSRHDSYLKRYIKTGEGRIIGTGRELDGRRRDGTTFPVHLTLAEVHYGRESYFTGSIHDLTERKQTEAAVQALFGTSTVGGGEDETERLKSAREIQRMRAYLENIVDSMPSVLVGVDTENRVTEWNCSAEKSTGVASKEAIGKAFSELFPELAGQLVNVSEAIRRRRPIRTERLPIAKRDETRYAEVMVYPLMANGAMGAVIRMDDITERVRIEQMMVQTEKMLSVGGLAAGMAHEISNPLSVVLQGAQNVLRRLSKELPANRLTAEELGLDLDILHRYLQARGITEFIKGIQDAGTRASRIVTDMLAFSRRSTSQLTPNRLDEMLEMVVRLAANDYDLKKKYDFRQIEIMREYDADLGEVLCDRPQIEQVFLNLIRNAAHAMAMAQTPFPRRITLRTRREGGLARVEVEDNGPGMDETTRRRAFEPFFTTKEAGVGTGLGLSVSYFIISEQHEGSISVSSREGEGCRFIITLPIAGTEKA